MKSTQKNDTGMIAVCRTDVSIYCCASNAVMHIRMQSLVPIWLLIQSAIAQTFSRIILVFKNQKELQFGGLKIVKQRHCDAHKNCQFSEAEQEGICGFVLFFLYVIVCASLCGLKGKRPSKDQSAQRTACAWVALLGASDTDDTTFSRKNLRFIIEVLDEKKNKNNWPRMILPFWQNTFIPVSHETTQSLQMTLPAFLSSISAIDVANPRWSLQGQFMNTEPFIKEIWRLFLWWKKTGIIAFQMNKHVLE